MRLDPDTEAPGRTAMPAMFVSAMFAHCDQFRVTELESLWSMPEMRADPVTLTLPAVVTAPWKFTVGYAMRTMELVRWRERSCAAPMLACPSDTTQKVLSLSFVMVTYAVSSPAT